MVCSYLCHLSKCFMAFLAYYLRMIFLTMYLVEIVDVVLICVFWSFCKLLFSLPQALGMFLCNDVVCSGSVHLMLWVCVYVQLCRMLNCHPMLFLRLGWLWQSHILPVVCTCGCAINFLYIFGERSARIFAYWTFLFSWVFRNSEFVSFLENQGFHTIKLNIELHMMETVLSERTESVFLNSLKITVLFLLVSEPLVIVTLDITFLSGIEN